MAVESNTLFQFDNSFVRDLAGLFVEWQPVPVGESVLLALNEPLAAELGVDPAALQSPEGLAVLAGNAVPSGASPIAMAYAGHQFGAYSPRLGDGRALLLGEVVDTNGARRDIHLKGSGRTPFARGGDGRAAVGPMLREYLIGEAMHALGIPTTRALAVVHTGEYVAREGMLPGAVLTRVAASHLRIGTFEYAARLGDPALLQRLADHAITRHHPAAAEGEQPYLALLEAVVEVQSALVARWMLVGFIHGVMNTDNMTISGETIDYGPCAFLDGYDPAAVYSSIDHGGRYAYGNQPRIAQWNLTRLAETLLPLIDDGADGGIDRAVAAATDVLTSFPDRFRTHWTNGMRAKLGLATARDDDQALFDDLLDLLHRERVDYTGFFRSAADGLRSRLAGGGSVSAVGSELDAWDAWNERWLARLAIEGDDVMAVADAMDRSNPRYIARNHLVEEALAAATDGDVGPFHELLDVVTHPVADRPEWSRFAEPAPDAFTRGYQTFCGT
jgi:serine/tyrosine/threonine adenylyltransferase